MQAACPESCKVCTHDSSRAPAILSNPTAKPGPANTQGAQPPANTPKPVVITKAAVTEPPQICAESRCASPDGDGGHDCWAVGVDADPYKCKGGWDPVLTGQDTDYEYQGVVYNFKEFDCCLDRVKSSHKCDESKCDSPDGSGGVGCWALGVETHPFKCKGGYKPVWTGTAKTVLFNGDEYELDGFNCCIDAPKPATQAPEPETMAPEPVTMATEPAKPSPAPASGRTCDATKCASPDGSGGFDCWAVGVDADPYKCSGGYKWVLTGKKAKYPHQGVVYDIAEFNCCKTAEVTKRPTSSRKCDSKKCTSDNGSGGYDCWAIGGNLEPFTCSGGYKAVLTGNTGQHTHQGTVYDLSEYNCCIDQPGQGLRFRLYLLFILQLLL